MFRKRLYSGLPMTQLYLVLKTGLISQANGSAYIEAEETKVTCAVYVRISCHEFSGPD